MHSKTILTLLALTTLSLVGCSNETIAPAYETSPDLPEYQQDSFDAYVNDTQDWLLKNRVFMTEDKQLEINSILRLSISLPHLTARPFY